MGIGTERRLPSVDDHHGFAGVLDGHQTFEQALVGTSLPNFAIVPGGATADSPLRLCTANNLHAPLEWLRQHYHYVVIDGPPVLDSPEMVSLATQVDGIVLVVRAARTKREIVQRAIETIDKFRKKETVPTKILLTDRLFDKANAAQFVADAY